MNILRFHELLFGMIRKLIPNYERTSGDSPDYFSQPLPRLNYCRAVYPQHQRLYRCHLHESWWCVSEVPLANNFHQCFSVLAALTAAVTNLPDLETSYTFRSFPLKIGLTICIRDIITAGCQNRFFFPKVIAIDNFFGPSP